MLAFVYNTKYHLTMTYTDSTYPKAEFPQMTAADPRVCCWGCEVVDEYEDGCRDVFCSCHDGIALVSGDPA